MANENDYIKDVDKLIPRPEIALEVMTIANESECDIPTLSNNIKKDPSLTANMLKFANSAYFGHMKQINSITDIIVRLGLDTVKMLAITSASVGVLKSPQEAYNLEPGSLWRHSYATALLSSIIGRWATADRISTLYSSALLHDVGKVILNRPLQLECINRGEVSEKNSIVEFEDAILHTNHSMVGTALLVKWGLPDEITTPICCHHSLQDCQHDLNSRIVYLANYLTESIGIQASDPEEHLYRIKEEYSSTDLLPEVPGFSENMESIISEFFEKFNETDTLVLMD